MSFIVDKEVLRAGLIIFRRADVAHRNWYCRVKLPKADRYKTVSLKTSNIETAREKAFDQDADVRFRIKHDVAIFNRSFAQVGAEYADIQDKRASSGEISLKRADLVRSIVEGRLTQYVGTTQIHLIGHDRWKEYPTWRRKAGQGRLARIGHTRPFTPEEAAAAEEKAAVVETKAAAVAARFSKLKRQPPKKASPRPVRDEWVMVSDATISTEMGVLRGVMSYAVLKRYVSADHRFENMPALETMHREEFTVEEYRSLHTKARAWIRDANPVYASSTWARTVAYNFILIMCNTGMRPVEAKNLRWRDISPAKDREGRDMFVLWVRGKDKQRKLVAPDSVGGYLDRIRAISNATKPDDPVFTNYNGEPAKYLYRSMLREVLTVAELLNSPSGIPRTAYCFRHTYATFRLSEGVDVYFLAEQLGTSVKMIEDHYGHVNTIRHADRVLQGMSGWNPLPEDSEYLAVNRTAPQDAKAGAARQAIKAKQPKSAPPAKKGPATKSDF